MDLPAWVRRAIQDFEAPATGKVVLELELYKMGITKIEIGGIVRLKPPDKKDV